MKINHVLGDTNWAALAMQKQALIEVIGMVQPTHAICLHGILHWIDALQDAAEIDGFPVVFLTEDKE